MSRTKGASAADDWVTLVGRILAGVPVLDGAACIDRHELFDPAEPDEDRADAAYRHEAAAAICTSCPALAQCRDWSSTVSRSTVAGHLPARPGRSEPREAA